MVSRGVFCTIEGGDGAGKSTLLAGLGERLRMQGHLVLVTREPGGCAVGEAIRELVLSLRPGMPIGARSELLLFLAARAQHLQEQVLPALASGQIVLCDRFNDSSVAYQGYGRGLPIEEVLQICRLATGGLEPDLTLYLDLPVELALQRARRRERSDRLECEDVSFHHRCRDGYLAQAERFPERMRVLDAMQKPEQIVEQAWMLLNSKLP